jgi:hypothetical protein
MLIATLLLAGTLLRNRLRGCSWQRADDYVQGWMGLPKVFGLTYVLSMLTVFTIYANPFVHTLAASTWPDSGELSQSLGVSAFLIQPALLMGIVLFGLRRWMLPFGMLTLVLLLNTALLSLLHDQVCYASERRNQYASLSAFTPPVQTAPPIGQDGGDLPPEYRDALSPLATRQLSLSCRSRGSARPSSRRLRAGACRVPVEPAARGSSARSRVLRVGRRERAALPSHAPCAREMLRNSHRLLCATLMGDAMKTHPS